MQRREFLTILGGVAAYPIMVRAQQTERKRRIGVLMAHAETDPEYRDYLAAFREGLHKLGWAEGRNIQIDPATTPYNDIYLKPFKAAALSLAVEAIAAPVHDLSDLDAAFAAQVRRLNSGIIIMPDGFMNVHRAGVVSLAARYRMPTVYPWRHFTELGGLLSYGNEQRDSFRLASTYADRILTGEKLGELPVQAPVKFELVINMKTAEALGLDVPLPLRQLADKIIE